MVMYILHTYILRMYVKDLNPRLFNKTKTLSINFEERMRITWGFYIYNYYTDPSHEHWTHGRRVFY